MTACSVPSRAARQSDAGAEQWSFVPQEGYSKLKRLRDHTPNHFDLGNTKPYFIDGSPTVFTATASDDPDDRLRRG